VRAPRVRASACPFDEGTGPPSALAKKAAVFQFNTINLANPQWDSPADGNAALADVVNTPNPINVTYNYYVSFDPMSLGYAMPPGLKFIPMIFGQTGVAYGSEYSAGNLTAAQTTANSPIGTGELLTFNEPNLGSPQAQLTPAQAAALWPSIRALGLRTGAPTMGWQINDPFPTWLADFVTAVGSADFDFIPIDIYGENFNDPGGEVRKIMAFVDAIYATYGLPIWIKETALISFDSLPSQPNDTQVRAYMAEAIAAFRASPKIERYFWYRVGPARDATASGYYNIGLSFTNGTPSAIGEYFKKLW